MAEASGDPLFSEAIQIAYSNPERMLLRKRPPLAVPILQPSPPHGRAVSEERHNRGEKARSGLTA